MPTGSWPRTRFFGLTIPTPGVQDFAARLLESLSDEVEVVGLDVRLPLDMDGDVAAGAKLKLTGAHEASAAGEEDVVSAVAAYVDGSVALASIVGIVPASVGAPTGSGVVSEPGGASFVPAGGSGGQVVETSTQSMSKIGGFVLDETSIMFDGTEPLMIHDASVAADALAEEDSGPGSRPVTGYDATDKIVRSTVLIASPGETITLWFPVWIPADFGSFYSGDAAPVLSVKYKATGAGSITLTFIDSAGASHAGLAESGDAAYTEVMLGYGDVDAATVTPLTLCWLTVLIEGSPGNTIDVENMLRIRYQRRSQF